MTSRRLPAASMAVFLTLTSIAAAVPKEPDAIVTNGIGADQTLWHLDFLTQCETSVPPLTGTGTTVFLLDSGCDTTHKEFENADITNVVLPSYNPAVKDPLGSGTHMASLIVGKNVGMAKASKVVCIRVYDDNGKSTEQELIDGIKLARDLHKTSPGPSVLLMTSIPTEQREELLYGCYDKDQGGSLKLPHLLCVDPEPEPHPTDPIYPFCNPPGIVCRNYLDRAMENAAKEGLITVTSAGNNGGDACDFSPSRVEFGLKFGALDENAAKWAGSNAGDCVDAYAPGVNVTGAWNSGANSYRSDRAKTSSAAALGVAIVARILEENSFLNVDQIRHVLVNASKPTDAGLAALNAPCEPVEFEEPTPPPAPTVAPPQPTPTPPQPTATPPDPTATPPELTPAPVEPELTEAPVVVVPEPTAAPTEPIAAPTEPTAAPTEPVDDDDDCSCDKSKSDKDSNKDKSKSKKDSKKDSNSDKDDSSHDTDRLEEQVERRSPKSSSGKGHKYGHYKDKKCKCKKDKNSKKDKSGKSSKDDSSKDKSNKD